jgi:hypothetical protein
MPRSPQEISKGGGGEVVEDDVVLVEDVAVAVDVAEIWQAPKTRPTRASGLALVFDGDPVTRLSALPINQGPAP